MSDKFSVIIRCRDEERWIGHTMQSVLDFIPNNEIIIVDNSSVDKSIEIAKSFKRDPDLDANNEHYTDVKIVNIDAYTPGASLNLGVSAASHDNIMIISSHCVIKRLNVDEILTALESHEGIFGKQNPIYQGKRIGKRYLWGHFTDAPVKNMYSDMEARFFFHNAASIFKRDSLGRFPFNENITGKEDRYWAGNVIKSGGSTLYDPINFEVDHHYTPRGNTWKGVG
jgi:rhamnosyltransferase